MSEYVIRKNIIPVKMQEVPNILKKCSFSIEKDKNKLDFQNTESFQKSRKVSFLCVVCFCFDFKLSLKIVSELVIRF